MLVGLARWASLMNQQLGYRISGMNERAAKHNGLLLIASMLTGICYPGRTGRQFLTHQRLAGMSSRSRSSLAATGMTLGAALFGIILSQTPETLSYAFLLSGSIGILVFRKHRHAYIPELLGTLGIMGIGLNAMITANIPIIHLPILLLAVIVITGLTEMPTLGIAAGFSIIPPDNSLQIWRVIIVAMITAWGWLTFTLMRIAPAFTPSNSSINIDDLAYPERALQGVLLQLKSMIEAFNQVTRLILDKENCRTSPPNLKRMQDLEKAINFMKPAAQRQLCRITQYRLTPRQSKLALFLYTNISDFERIADHFCSLVKHLRRLPQAYNQLPAPMQSALPALLTTYQQALASLQLLTGKKYKTNRAADKQLHQHSQTQEALDNYERSLQDTIDSKKANPRDIITLREIHAHIERPLHHIRAIAMTQEQDDFGIDPDAIHITPGKLPRTKPHPFNPPEVT